MFMRRHKPIEDSSFEVLIGLLAEENISRIEDQVEEGEIISQKELDKAEDNTVTALKAVLEGKLKLDSKGGFVKRLTSK